ncbi:MAG: glucuronate isomerase [Puniceicoccaceae bacterium]|nr:MAG: glucuronate isomerase [Puniceicoccaceae bacterium]
MKAKALKPARLEKAIDRLVEKTPVYDIHTHLYDPAFGELLLWGIDDLLVYHYLVAEVFRYHDLSYKDFWKLSKTEQADLVWEELFLKHSPVSEACRGVLTTLNRFGLDVRKRDLPKLRKWFARQKPAEHVTRCMEAANVRTICMTNSPFDPLEYPVWEKGFARDPRFTAALRVDPLLVDWKGTVPFLREQGYAVTPALNAKTISELRRFLDHWAGVMEPLFLMVSLPWDFKYPDSSDTAKLIDKVVLPFCRERGLPFAMMPGVKRGLNPGLQLAGDAVGRSDLECFERMIAANDDVKFLLTVLSRENQYQLCVMARKFRNLHIFGCWWFLNNPVIIEDMTRMRLELLGLSVTPQHSDARVLDQIVYKWTHSREIIARVLKDKYRDLAATGWEVTEKELERDIRLLFGGAFEAFLAR